PRKRSLLSEGTMDYSLGFIKGYEMQNYNYSVSGGLELLGGDFRTTVSGYHSNLADVLDLRFINWRYVPEPNGYLTEFCVGNIVTSGMLRRHVLGMALSNEPVIPPEVQSSEILDGYTDPGSEIELYINSRMYDFTLADENGYYRFEYDLRYGSASISLHIYKPSGETVIKNSRVDMPFSLLPRGKLYYNIQGGVIDDIPVMRDSGNYVFHGDVGYALFKNITARIGGDYFNKYTTPAFYTGLSARVLNNVFFDVDHSPNKFSRAGTRVRYHSGAGAKILYTMFEGNGIYNEGVARRRVNAGFYLPFTVFNSHNGFRADCEQEEYDDFSNTRCSFSLSSRLKRLTLRTDYSGQFSAQTGPLCYHGGFISLAAGYMFSHLKGIPLFLRGMYFYAEWQGEPADLSSGNAEFRVSRSLWSNGQLGFQLYYDRNNNKMNIQSTVCIDLKPFRLVNRFSGSGRSGIMRQKVHGSLTLDAANRKIITSNRPQTGRSGVAVIMFVDANSNGCFDEGELIVPSRAIHLDQSANYELGKDGVLRINNLTGYRKYNAEIIREYMPDPLLAPKTMRFSFITDPNRFKQIEVPLYRTGVLEGKVTVCDGKDSYGQGGIRLIIKGMNNMFEKTIRTFSDGTFYCMGIMPGHYTLEADPVQCDLLNAESVPGIHEFEVKAVAGGDFVKRDIIINSGEISR
ncbi:MAG: hypothetical protein PHH93_05860, partial [Prolixibacteraceae bacterium]|nr:hypothetical protein [Prolixibacteraceae bacterium]